MNVNTVHKPSDETNPPLVSVVLPVYNGEKYLAAAIESILTQTFNKFELIAVDDGSTDGSLQILKRYAQNDPRVQVISRVNKGLPATLNEAIDAARGQLIARMDADDISLPNRLARQYEFMCQHPEVVALGSAARFIDEEGYVVCTYFPHTDDATLRQVFPGSPFIHPSVMFRNEAFYRAGKYPEKMKWGGEDVVIFGRLAKLGELRNISEPLIKYRLVPGSMSRKPAKFRSLLVSIVQSEIAGNLVDDEELKLLQQEAANIDKSHALFDYYFEVAKLCLWSGSSRKKTAAYLKSCRDLRQSYFKVLFMYFLVILPPRLVRAIYFRLKGRRYEPERMSQE